MYAKQPKNLLILNILDILWKDTDQDHRLTQREIGESRAPNAAVLEPPELRKKIGDMLRRTAALYE